MTKINMNKVAKTISEVEGKRVEVNITQIKEVSKCLLTVLAQDFDTSQIEELISRYR